MRLYFPCHEHPPALRIPKDSDRAFVANLPSFFR